MIDVCSLPGIGSFCPLDELTTAGLVNYFGRMSDINRELVLTPVLLKKELNGKATTIALYGISAMKDERLFKLLYEKKVLINLSLKGTPGCKIKFIFFDCQSLVKTNGATFIFIAKL